MRLMKLALMSLVLSLGLPACGGNSSPTAPAWVPTTTLPPTTVIVASASPDPIIAEACTVALFGAGFAFLATTTITLRETGGLAANVDFINLTFRTAGTNIEFGTITFNQNDITSRAGGIFIAANGQLVIPRIGGIYRLGGGGREVLFTIAIRVIDGLGRPINTVLTVRVV